MSWRRKLKKKCSWNGSFSWKGKLGPFPFLFYFFFFQWFLSFNCLKLDFFFLCMNAFNDMLVTMWKQILVFIVNFDILWIFCKEFKLIKFRLCQCVMNVANYLELLTFHHENHHIYWVTTLLFSFQLLSDREFEDRQRSVKRFRQSNWLNILLN